MQTIDVPSRPQPAKTAPLALVAWAAIALAIAANVRLSRAPALLPIVLFGTVLGLLAAQRFVPSVRAFVAARSDRALVALHVARAPIGALFLYEHAHGRLPALFAIRAGVGDLLVGLAALALIAGARPRSRWIVLAWNALGLLDILLVVGTAVTLVLVRRDATMLAALDRALFAALPLMIVPLVIATHALLFGRLVRARDASAGPLSP